MKINMNVELTPQELRELLGLPDVQGFHQDMMDKIRERMEQGMEGYDPLTFFKPYAAGSTMGMDVFQKWGKAAVGGAAKASTTKNNER